MVFKGQPVKAQQLQQFFPSQILIGPFKIDRQKQSQKPLYMLAATEWSVSEISKYGAFALHNRKLIEQSPQSVLWGLYKQMSIFVGTRNFRQCKNYHCRLMKHWKKINTIIEHYKNTVDNFNQELGREKQNIKMYYKRKKLLGEGKCETKQNISKNETTSTNYITGMSETNIGENSNALRNQASQMATIDPTLASLNKSLEDQWVQCHQLFLQWTQRLKELNEMNINF